MSEAGLTTQVTKNMVYVHPSAKTAWIVYLKANPRVEDTNILSLNYIPVRRLHIPDELDDDFYNSL
jgi:hypothetical protein